MELEENKQHYTRRIEVYCIMKNTIAICSLNQKDFSGCIMSKDLNGFIEVVYVCKTDKKAAFEKETLASAAYYNAKIIKEI